MEEREIKDNRDMATMVAIALKEAGEAKAMSKEAIEDAREALMLREESHLVFEGIRSTIKVFLSIISLCTFTMAIIRAIPTIALWLG